MTADLRRNVNFGHFTVLHVSHPNEQIFTFQVSCGHLVVIFIILKDFPESRKNWRFSWPRTCEKSHFWAFHIFAYFSPKWANIYISSVLWSTGGDFHHFKSLSRKSKKLKFFMTADLWRNVNFGHFTVLHISHPNEQTFTFQVSCGHLVVIFIILKDFPESRKNWRFSWPRTCEKLSFLGISHFRIFLTQMSKYLHFKCPVVNWWWFSSF